MKHNFFVFSGAHLIIPVIIRCLTSLFMALPLRLIACGNSVATFTMDVGILTGPVVMAAAGIVVGLQGVLLRVAIFQAALTQGIVPFVFTKEYNVHPDILNKA